MATAFLPQARSRPLLFAHRGLARRGAHANTLAACEAALYAGADAVEVDLRLAKGGSPVLHHDRELLVDGAAVAIDELDADERQRQGISDLQDLDGLRAQWPDRGVVIDVKTRAAGEALFARWAPDPRNMVISFSDHVVVRAVELGWNAALIEGFRPMILRDLVPVDAYLSPALGNVADYAEQLDDGELGRCVLGVVNDPGRALALARRGVFALTTTNVRGLRRALRRDT
jgi:hypothetical protein